MVPEPRYTWSFAFDSLLERHSSSDGQQRLTSLAALLTGKPVKVKNSRRPIDIMFNLDYPDDLSKFDVSEDEDSVDDDENGDELEIEDEDSADEVQDYLKKMTFVVLSRALENNKSWVRVTDIFQKTDNQIIA